MVSYPGYLFWLALLAALASVAAGWLAPKPDATPRFARWGWHALWAAALLKVAFLQHTALAGHVTQWPDDFTRLHMSLPYRDNLFTSFGGQIWPGLQLVINGLCMRLFADPVIAMRWLAVVFSVLGVFAAGWAAFEISRSTAGAVSAAFLVAASPFHTWLGMGVMTEVPHAAFVTASLAAALAAFRLAESRCRCAGPLWIVSGLCATAACGYRYEAWMYLAAAAPILVLRWAWLRWGARLPESLRPMPEQIATRPHGGWLLAGGACAGLFPALWMALSWKNMGSPLQFMKNQTEMNGPSLEWSLSERARVLLEGMNNQVEPLWPLAIAGVLVALVLAARRRTSGFGTLVLLGYFAFIFMVMTVKGYGVSVERYVLLFVVGGTALVALAFTGAEFLVRGATGARRWVAIAALVLNVATIGAFAAESGRALTRYKWWGYRTETFAVGEFLAQEFHEPQNLPGLARGGRVLIWCTSQNHFVQFWEVILMSGHVDRFDLHAGPAIPEGWAAMPDATIMQVDGPADPPAPGYRLAARIGTIAVWHTAGPEG